MVAWQTNQIAFFEGRTISIAGGTDRGLARQPERRLAGENELTGGTESRDDQPSWNRAAQENGRKDRNREKMGGHR